MVVLTKGVSQGTALSDRERLSWSELFMLKAMYRIYAISAWFSHGMHWSTCVFFQVSSFKFQVCVNYTCAIFFVEIKCEFFTSFSSKSSAYRKVVGFV
jgi:hypothetical protein